MEQKLYTIAGTARNPQGVLTFRFASGTHAKREGVLRRAGFDRIQFWDLPNAMTLEEAQAWLVSQGHMAFLPSGQRRGENGGTVRAVPRRAPQHDAHVQSWRAWQEHEVRAKQAFVARMAAARAAKRAAAQQAA